MPSMTEITCKCGCGRKRMVRTADVKRGWGKFYSKSCKAKHQERRTGQCAAYHHRQRNNENNYRGSGVSKEKFLRYADEYGGTPQFHPITGEYEGFSDHTFDNTANPVTTASELKL